MKEPTKMQKVPVTFNAESHVAHACEIETPMAESAATRPPSRIFDSDLELLLRERLPRISQIPESLHLPLIALVDLAADRDFKHVESIAEQIIQIARGLRFEAEQKEGVLRL